jgi:hypothetical protein
MPGGAGVIAPLRWFLRVAAALALIAGIQLFVGAAHTDRYFSWTIEPPLTAAFMGAAYWAAAVLLGWAGAQASWARARSAIPPVITIALLLLVATLAHLDKFDLDSLYGWFWLVVYVLVTPLVLWLLALQRRIPTAPEPAGPRLPRPLVALLAVQGVAMLGFGIALMVAPVGTSDAWPWPLTPLTGRATGAFLVGFGVAAAVAVREADLNRYRGPACAYATLGGLELLAAAIHWEDLTASALGCAVYMAFWATVLAAGAYGSIASSAASASR